MKISNKIILIIIFLLKGNFAAADEPQPPSITVTQDRTTVTVEWSPVFNAKGYQLLYASHSYTGSESIKINEMNSTTFITSEL